LPITGDRRNDWIIPNGLKLSGIPRAGKRGAPGGWSAAGEANPEYSLPGTFEPHSQSISRRSAQGKTPSNAIHGIIGSIAPKAAARETAIELAHST